MEEQLKLAIEYLKIRSIKTNKKSLPNVLKIQHAVCPIFEVEAVLNMVLTLEFEDFYNEFKKEYPNTK